MSFYFLSQYANIVCKNVSCDVGLTEFFSCFFRCHRQSATEPIYLNCRLSRSRSATDESWGRSGISNWWQFHQLYTHAYFVQMSFWQLFPHTRNVHVTRRKAAKTTFAQKIRT